MYALNLSQSSSLHVSFLLNHKISPENFQKTSIFFFSFCFVLYCFNVWLCSTRCHSLRKSSLLFVSINLAFVLCFVFHSLAFHFSLTVPQLASVQGCLRLTVHLLSSSSRRHRWLTVVTRPRPPSSCPTRFTIRPRKMPRHRHTTGRPIQTFSTFPNKFLLNNSPKWTV